MAAMKGHAFCRSCLGFSLGMQSSCGSLNHFVNKQLHLDEVKLVQLCDFLMKHLTLRLSEGDREGAHG